MIMVVVSWWSDGYDLVMIMNGLVSWYDGRKTEDV